MAISFNNALGIHQYTVGVRERNAEMISSNIAQANTPGYKAKALDFNKALQAASSGADIHLSRTDGRHIPASMAVVGKLFTAFRHSRILVMAILWMLIWKEISLCKTRFVIRLHLIFLVANSKV